MWNCVTRSLCETKPQDSTTATASQTGTALYRKHTFFQQTNNHCLEGCSRGANLYYHFSQTVYVIFWNFIKSETQLRNCGWSKAHWVIHFYMKTIRNWQKTKNYQVPLIVKICRVTFISSFGTVKISKKLDEQGFLLLRANSSFREFT